MNKRYEEVYVYFMRELLYNKENCDVIDCAVNIMLDGELTCNTCKHYKIDCQPSLLRKILN